MSDKNHIGLTFARFNGNDKTALGETMDHCNQCIITSIERLVNRLEAENLGMSIITMGQRLDKILIS